jgi:hypothetical protein
VLFRSEYIDFNVYGGSTPGTGDTLRITGKKSGSIRITVSHPLAENLRSVYIVIKDVVNEAKDASTYITTSQNYIVTKTGNDNTVVSIIINNARPGDETDLHWSIVHDAKDGSANPVISFEGGTGTSSSSSARSAYVPTTSGSGIIKPLREGTAVIALSHPKAYYDTNISVTVLAADTVQVNPLVLSTDDALITLVNGNSTTITVSLTGEGKLPADDAAIQWQSSDPSKVSVTPNGTTASITALGSSGTSREIITVTHPKAATPIQIAAIHADTRQEIASAKFVYANEYYYLLQAGQEVTISASIFNEEETDRLSWMVTSGLNTVVTISQLMNQVIKVTGTGNGMATITALLNGTTQSCTFNIIVKTEDAVNDLASYLTTSQNVVVMETGDEKEITVTPINIPMTQNLTWVNDNPSLLEVVPNNTTAVVRAKDSEGSASVSVSHPHSLNTLTINVHIGSQYVYQNTNIAYISTPTDTLVLRAGGEEHQFQVVLAHTETAETSNTGFSYAVSDTAVASIRYTGTANLVFIKPLKAGQAVLTINHAGASPREVLIIVERAEGDTGNTSYITSQNNVITVVAGETVTAAVSLINVTSYNSSDWSWVSNNKTVADVVANNGTAAMIRGYKPGTAAITVSNSYAPMRLPLPYSALIPVLPSQTPGSIPLPTLSI